MVYRSTLGSPVFGLRREIDRLFEDTFGRSGGRATWVPAVDIREDQKEIVFEIELPGIKPEHVDVTAENGVLTVRGEKESVVEEGSEGRYHLVERSYGTFVRSFQLPPGVDDQRIEADFENGILVVHVPKAALPQPRRIEIRNSGSQQAISGPAGSGSGTQRKAGSPGTSAPQAEREVRGQREMTADREVRGDRSEGARAESARAASGAQGRGQGGATGSSRETRGGEGSGGGATGRGNTRSSR